MLFLLSASLRGNFAFTELQSSETEMCLLLPAFKHYQAMFNLFLIKSTYCMRLPQGLSLCTCVYVCELHQPPRCERDTVNWCICVGFCLFVSLWCT